MRKRIVTIAKNFFECAVMKKTELQRRRAEFKELIRQGKHDEVLSIISTHLAQNSANGVFPGLVSDYMAGDELLDDEALI